MVFTLEKENRTEVWNIKTTDKYLDDYDPEPIDTSVFGDYATNYHKNYDKILADLLSKIKSFINKHKDEIKENEDINQWLRDDIGDYFTGILSETDLKFYNSMLIILDKEISKWKTQQCLNISLKNYL